MSKGNNHQSIHLSYISIPGQLFRKFNKKYKNDCINKRINKYRNKETKFGDRIIANNVSVQKFTQYQSAR